MRAYNETQLCSIPECPCGGTLHIQLVRDPGAEESLVLFHEVPGRPFMSHERGESILDPSVCGLRVRRDEDDEYVWDDLREALSNSS